MMTKISVWIKAFRLRTLPLAFSCILAGSSIALNNRSFNLSIFLGCIVTTLLFQVLSNLANDYGDGVKGTDNNDRVGPDRAMQKGLISKKQMKTAIIINSILSIISSIFLIYMGLKGADSNVYLTYFTLTLLSIFAAITYTVGKKAYGYSGLGDLSVYLFFGIIGVLASSYLFNHHFNILNILLANTIGLLSVAVLNLNNMRDIENDRNSNKNTLVVKIGLKKAKQYHLLIITFSFISLLAYTIINHEDFKSYIPLFTYILIFKDLSEIIKINTSKEFDPYLKKTALKTFLLSFLIFITQLL